MVGLLGLPDQVVEQLVRAVLLAQPVVAALQGRPDSLPALLGQLVLQEELVRLELIPLRRDPPDQPAQLESVRPLLEPRKPVPAQLVGPDRQAQSLLLPARPE